MVERERGDLSASLEYFKLAFAVVNYTHATADNGLLGMKSWSLTNVFTVAGLLSYWGDGFEAIEQAVTQFYSSPGSELRRTPTMDPYTFSLVRYASLESDLNTNRQACSRHVQGRARSPAGFESSHISKLNVGYLSFDWRDHPVRLFSKHSCLTN